MPAVLTVINVVAQLMTSRPSAVRFRASALVVGSEPVRRNSVLQRGQRATARGAKAGTHWNSPHPGHSRVVGGVISPDCRVLARAHPKLPASNVIERGSHARV